MRGSHDPDRAAMRAALGRFLPGDTVHEIRIPNVDGRKGAHSGYFNDPDRATAALAAYAGERAAGIYITVNHCNPALLSRAANRLQPYAKHATGDADIPGYRRFFIDVDSDRPAGICATVAEREAAIQRASTIAAFLSDQGWPAPQMVITSGNGAYLIYGLELPNDADARLLIDQALKALGTAFSGDGVIIDTGVGNPSRIMRLPGTWNAKGDDTPERPWRLATADYCEDAPAVTVDQLERVAVMAPQPEPHRAPRSITVPAGTRQRSWDIAPVLEASGIAFDAKERPYGTVYTLTDLCLTSDDHSDGASVIELPDGTLLYRCLHQRCNGKTWHDAKQHPRLNLPESAKSSGNASGTSEPTRKQYPAGSSAPAPRVAIVRSLADVEAKPLEWYWRGWLPTRMLALLGGYGGDGKSTLLASLIATFSRGGKLPDGSRAPVVNTLMLAAEDDAEYAIRPRLDRHRADVSRVHLLEGTRLGDGERAWFDLRQDCSAMRDVIEARDIGLVVIDPLSSYMPKSDRNSEGDVRDALSPLTTLMEATGVAVIGVLHVGKADGGRRVMQRLMGSTAFTAMARSVWAVHDLPKEHQPEPTGPDDEQPKRKVLGVVKSNYSIPPKALVFSIPLDDALRFHGESPISIDDAFNGESGRNTKQANAEAWLTDYLKGGSKLAREAFAAATADGISEATLKRAKEALDIKVQKGREPNAPWYWALPTFRASGAETMRTFHNVEETEDAHASILDTFRGYPDKLPREPESGKRPASGEASKMLTTPYRDTLSTFDASTASGIDQRCCEPDCKHPLAPGNRYYCEEHAPDSDDLEDEGAA
jgi:hypothetical protein